VGSPLWLVEARLDDGAELHWDDDHGDEVVYVADGSLEVDGVPAGGRAAAIVESGVATRVCATSDAHVLVFGSVRGPSVDGPLGPPHPRGHTVHVVGLDDAVALDSADGLRTSVHYADSSCPTCRVTFFENVFRGPTVTASHTHSQDELMCVTGGEIQMGPSALHAGETVSIPGGRRYGFRAAGPTSFLNYRCDRSFYVGAPGSPPIAETIDTIRGVRSGEILTEASTTVAPGQSVPSARP
jgi:hypothetical protein